MDDIKNIGTSTYLYIQSFKYLSILLALLLVIYGCYTLATNVVAAEDFKTQSAIETYNTSDPHLYTSSYLRISLSSKMANPTDTNQLYYYISCWLGLVTVIVWIVVLSAIKYVQNKDIGELNEDTQSAPDYSVVMEGCPLDIEEKDLQRQLNEYYEALVQHKNIPEEDREPLKIVKINIGKPFYLLDDNIQDEEIKQLETDLKETKEQIIELILERRDKPRFSMPEEERKALYKKYENLKERKVNLYTDQIEKVKEELR